MHKIIKILAFVIFITSNSSLSIAGDPGKKAVTSDYLLEKAKKEAARKALIDKAEKQKDIDPCSAVLNPELYNRCVANQKLYGVDIRAKQEKDNAAIKKKIDRGNQNKRNPSKVLEVENPSETKGKVYTLREILGESKGANAEEFTIDKLRNELWEVEKKDIPEDSKKEVPLMELE